MVAVEMIHLIKNQASICNANGVQNPNCTAKGQVVKFLTICNSIIRSNSLFYIT